MTTEERLAPLTAAGRRLLSFWESQRGKSGRYTGGMLADILAIEQEATARASQGAEGNGPHNWEQYRHDHHWPTPNHMRRTAEALDTLTPAKYGDVLRWVADACDDALAATPQPAEAEA